MQSSILVWVPFGLVHFPPFLPMYPGTRKSDKQTQRKRKVASNDWNIISAQPPQTATLPQKSLLKQRGPYQSPLAVSGKPGSKPSLGFFFVDFLWNSCGHFSDVDESHEKRQPRSRGLEAIWFGSLGRIGFRCGDWMSSWLDGPDWFFVIFSIWKSIFFRLWSS